MDVVHGEPEHRRVWAAERWPLEPGVQISDVFECVWQIARPNGAS